MKIKKNDNVLITSGKDRGKKGKVLRAFPKEDLVLVEGINLKTKHSRPKKSGEKGEKIHMPSPINVSNARLICPKCDKAVKVGHKILENGKKIRVCKKCGQDIS